MTACRRLLAAALLAATLAPAGALAAPCAGFTDVDDTDPFCANVQWLRNRAITFGCTATTYCPASPVSRLAMAAFLNRLANALTPVYLGSNLSWSAVNNTLTPGILACPSGAYTPTFPARARGFATAMPVNAGDDVDVAMQFMVSTDGGTTYAPISPQHAVSSDGIAPTTLHVNSVAVLMPPLDLAVGVDYRFALRIIRVPGSATTAGATGLCQMHVLIENRNPSTPPLDAATRADGAV